MDAPLRGANFLLIRISTDRGTPYGVPPKTNILKTNPKTKYLKINGNVNKSENNLFHHI
jgi:hypothetical protein